METSTQNATPVDLDRLVRLAPDTRIETTALPAQFGTGPATDCWIVQDDGGDTVLIGYGHDDRATVPRSLISLPNAERIHGGMREPKPEPASTPLDGASC